MAAPPIVLLRDVAVSFGARPLFERLTLGLGPQDHLCLLGRNGSGKSTLMKLIQGRVEPHAGERFVQPGVRIASLDQEPRFDPDVTVRQYAEAPDENDLAAEPHEAEAALDRVGIDADRPMGALSGGEARRAALAAAIARRPDLLLLDEPTNHLDLPTIEWLEGELGRWAGALLVVSHDRAFLDRVCRGMVWLERGRLHTTGRPFREFDEWCEEILNAEAREAERLDKHLAQEARWLERGVTARRKRNQGRLRRLHEMRAARAAMLGGRDKAKMMAVSGEVRSRTVIEAEHVSKSWATPDGGEHPIVRDFSVRVLRGDRIGLIGPNGAGKTTLLRLLTGDLEPDAGEVRLARAIRPAYFDQTRAQLDPAETPWSTLCPEGGDTVDVQGRPRHVVGYLKDFLFTADQARSPVSTLSGGERNRLMLARILAQPADLLVMDEPTNDLDMDTLDLLEEMLGDYDGTLIVVSHDRDFLDRIVTSTIALEGDGTAQEYAGGYTDYLAQRGERKVTRAERPKRAPESADRGEPQPREQRRLSYKEKRALEQLPAEIERLTGEIEKLESALSDADLYARDARLFEKATVRLEAARQELDQAETAWLELEEKREAVEGGAG